MGQVRKPQFEQYLHELTRGRPLGSQEVAQYRSRIMDLLEQVPEILVNKASVTGHPEMRLDFKCSWLGPDWSLDDVAKSLGNSFPADLFPVDGGESHLVESEDEVVALKFAVNLNDGYLTGRIRVLPS